MPMVPEMADLPERPTITMLPELAVPETPMMPTQNTSKETAK